VEDEAVHADDLVVGHADALDEPGLVAERAQRRHEPAVAVAALAHVVGRGPVDVELRVVEDVDDALDGLRPEGDVGVAVGTRKAAGPGRRRPGQAVALAALVLVVGLLGPARVAPVVQAVQAVAAVELEVQLEVEVRVTVLLVDAAALLDDLGHLGLANGRRLVVRGLRRLPAGHGPRRAALGRLLGVVVLGDDLGC